MRFCLLMIAKHRQGADNFAKLQKTIYGNSADINFTGKLQQVFRAVLAGTLKRFWLMQSTWRRLCR
jgi:hypothetical protein